MDFEKFKWKMEFRKRKLKGFFKLCKYEFLHRFNLEGGEGHIHHLIRQNLKSLVTADTEQEYLEVHGLLPDEPEEEESEAAEVEPEPVPELGLLKRYAFNDMMCFTFSIGDTIFCVNELKEFEDRTEIEVKIITGEWGEVERVERAVVSHVPGDRYDPVSLDGEDFRWDRAEGRLRFMPVVCEKAAMSEEKGPVRTVQELVLRVDKALAEERLSPLCLEYAYQCSDAGYDWCIPDHSHLPVLHELELAQTETAKQKVLWDLRGYCRYYWEESGLSR